MNEDKPAMNPVDPKSPSRVGRRVVLGATAWSVPVISVIGATPAFAASGATALNRTTPATPTFTASQSDATQALSVTLVNGAAAVASAVITFTISGGGGTWLSLSSSTGVTNASGVATTTLQYGTKPDPGTSATLVATYQDLQVVWTVTYTPTLMVARTGDGTTALSSSAAPVFIDEYSQAGTLVRTINLPTATSGANSVFTQSGSAGSEGAVSLSGDHRYITVAGYGAAPGTASVATTAATATPRVVARVSASGAVDTSTALTDVSTGKNFRSAATSDGAGFYTVGGVGGTRLGALGATSSTSIQTASANNRVVQVVRGNLYFSTGSGTPGVYQTGSGLPTATATNTLIAGTGAGTSPYAFVFFDRDTSVSGVDSLYIIDSAAGISKWALVAGTWTRQGAVDATVKGTGLAGFVGADGKVTLFATITGASANNLVSVQDTSASSTSALALGSATTLATAATNTVFHGIAFAPDA